LADPLAAVAALDGVGSAAAHARDAVDALLRHPAMRRDAARVAAESAVRGADASATLAVGSNVEVAHPVMQGALRATAAVPEVASVWERSPHQALARLHVLAARDLTADVGKLGRPRPDVDNARLEQLLQLATSPTDASAVVLAAIVHGELAALAPFHGANDLVARAAERLVLVVRGVDRAAAAVPEAGHLAHARDYKLQLEGYLTGEPMGVAAWVRHCAEAYARGAEVGLSVVENGV
jgi:hypothetical protein